MSPNPQTASVFLTTLGCRLNEAELLSWGNAFEDRGHRLVSSSEDANLVIVNTCAVTAQAARKSRKFISALHRQNPSARLVVTGCMSELEPAKAASLLGVDLVIDNGSKDELAERVLEALELGTMPELASAPDSNPIYSEEHGGSKVADSSLVKLGKHREERTRAFVKVQDGCRNHCSYCVVTIARGEERSRTIDEVVREINGLVNKGYREAVLTGVHLGGYGKDLETNLSALVAAILTDTDIQRLRLSSLEPWDLPPDFGTLWQHPRLMPHLHLPLQSGSNSVLRRMARRCFTDEYRSLVEKLRNSIEDLNLTTDLIVGFPGETDDEFADSLRFVEEIGFGHTHIFAFSPRQGTKAATLPHQVPGPIARDRSRQGHQVAARMKERFMQSYLGTHRAVLWEGGVSEATRGYTDNYLRVESSLGLDTTLRGHVSEALLLELAGTPTDRLVATPARIEDR